MELVKSGERLPTELTIVEGKSAAVRALKVGAAALPEVGPAHTVLADCAVIVNEIAGVVEGLDTEVVKNGAALPALNDVTVPVEPPEAAIVIVPAAAVTVILLPATILLYSNPIPECATPSSWSAEPGALNDGAADEPEKLPKSVPALALESVNESA